MVDAFEQMEVDAEEELVVGAEENGRPVLVLLPVDAPV